MVDRHNFVMSDSVHKYERLVYCTYCGLVTWHFNSSNNDKYQAKVGNPCIGKEQQ